MDQVGLSQSAENTLHQPPMGRRVGLCVAEGAEPGSLLFGDRRERVRQVAGQSSADSDMDKMDPSRLRH